MAAADGDDGAAEIEGLEACSVRGGGDGVSDAAPGGATAGDDGGAQSSEEVLVTATESDDGDGLAPAVGLPLGERRTLS